MLIKGYNKKTISRTTTRKVNCRVWDDWGRWFGIEGIDNRIYFYMVPASWHSSRNDRSKDHMDRPGYPLFKIYAALLGKQTQRWTVIGQCDDKRMAEAMAHRGASVPSGRAGKSSQMSASSSERLRL